MPVCYRHYIRTNRALLTVGRVCGQERREIVKVISRCQAQGAEGSGRKRRQAKILVAKQDLLLASWGRKES